MAGQKSSFTDRQMETFATYARTLMKEGKSGYQVERALMEQGLDEHTASLLVSQVWKKNATALTRGRVTENHHVVIGFITLSVGLAITLGTYLAAATAGRGVYWVFYGLIMIGTIQLIFGLAQHYRG